MSYALEQPEWLRSHARISNDDHHFSCLALYITYIDKNTYELEQPEWLRSRARATKSLHHYAWNPLYC